MAFHGSRIVGCFKLGLLNLLRGETNPLSEELRSWRVWLNTSTFSKIGIVISGTIWLRASLNSLAVNLNKTQMLWASFVSLFPHQALINKWNNEVQKAQNSTAELLAGKKVSVPAGGMKGKNKLGLRPRRAWPRRGLLWQLSRVPGLIPAGGAPQSWAPAYSLFSQNHRTVGVGRDLCGSSRPTLLLKEGHLQ